MSIGWLSVLDVGSEIIAIKTVGPVRKGTRGVVTDMTRVPFLFFWSRTVYLCTFAGNISLAARPGEIGGHGQAPAQWRSFRTG